MMLACITMRMSLNEALVASTLNAAFSIRRSKDTGSIEVGKWGDLIILDTKR